MLKQKDLALLKEKLLKEKETLEQELSKLATKEEDGSYEAKHIEIGRDEESNADEVESYADNLDIIKTLENNLKEVKEALIQMENKTYGKCTNCHKEIPLERLLAYPSATVCLNCKK